MTIKPSTDYLVPAAVFDRATWTPLLELSSREVFEIMLGTRLDLMQRKDENKGQFTALVGLAGSICGVLSVRCSSDTARAVAGKMLGMAPEYAGKESFDALGEIANMIAGNFKAKLCCVGNTCMLSIPTIIVGSDYESRSMMACDVIEIACEFEKNPLCITLELHD